MDDITHAEQVEPGRWHVHVARWNFRQVKVMTTEQFSRMLAGMPYETQMIYTEWEADTDEDISDGTKSIPEG